ncbi:FAD-binding protein [bacterium]|nr:FAD-binding protein [bacterium]
MLIEWVLIVSNTIQTIHPKSNTQNMHSIKVIQPAKTIKENYKSYLMDESRFAGGKADQLIFAYSEDQISRTMRQSFQSNTPVTISAGRTGIVGGAIPLEGTLLSLEGMDQLVGVRWNDKDKCWYVQVQPGVSLQRLQEILDTNDQILYNYSKKFAEESDHWFYPPDPTEKSAHLGGTVATNASGARSFKYGQTRNYISGLRIMLSDGSVISLQRGKNKISSQEYCTIHSRYLNDINIHISKYRWPAVKNTAGYYISDPMDMIDLFIGSEGTLGIITEIEVGLREKPDFILGGISFFSSEESAFRFVRLIRETTQYSEQHVNPTALEFFDDFSLQLLRQKSQTEGSNSKIPSFPDHAKAAVYFEQEGVEVKIDEIYNAYQNILTRCNASMEETWGGFEKGELKQMVEFRHAVPEAINTIIGQRQKKIPNLHKISTDIVVPTACLEKIVQIYHQRLDKNGFEYAIFGHIGENHLHLNILPRDEEELAKAKNLSFEFAQAAVTMGGTVSGEHGIGKIKKEYFQIMYDPDTIQEMRNIKNGLDPKNILGRGTLFT